MDGFDLLYDDTTMDESLTLHDYSDEGVSVHTVALHLKIKGGGLSRGVSKRIVKSKGEKQVVAGDANGFQTTFNTCAQTCGNGNFSVNRHCCVGCHGAIWPLLQCNSLKRWQHTGRTIAPLLRPHSYAFIYSWNLQPFMPFSARSTVGWSSQSAETSQTCAAMRLVWCNSLKRLQHSGRTIAPF